MRDYTKTAINLLRPVNNLLHIPELEALRLAVSVELERAYNEGVIEGCDQMTKDNSWK